MPAAFESLCVATRFDVVDADALDSAILRSAVAAWKAACGTRLYPAREDLKPRAIASEMPYMSLLKVIDGGADFEHRIVGDVLARAFAVPIQNRRFSDIAWEAPELIEFCLPRFRQVVASKQPLAWHQSTGLDAASVVFADAEIVLLPLGASDDTVDHIVAFGFYQARLAAPA